MKGKILLLFFSMFALISILIPAPLFPGNWLCLMINRGLQNYIDIFSAVFNGLFYGIIVWLFFIGITRKIS